jgi:hypothetical protein
VQIISREEAKKLGLKRYFTGKSCSRGHISERFVSTYNCLLCMADYNKALENDPVRKDHDRKVRRERAKKRMAKLKLENPLFHEKYKKYMRDYNRERWANDPEFAKDRYQKTRKWFKNNPEASRAFASKRRKAVKEGEGFSRQDVKDLLRKQGDLCAEPTCKIPLNGKYHVDHIMPIALGGKHALENIQCLCPPCNHRKAAKHPDIWDKENGR